MRDAARWALPETRAPCGLHATRAAHGASCMAHATRGAWRVAHAARTTFALACQETRARKRLDII
ncbi:MAG: hypothetical protein AMJ72_05425 [Acidithiobacillales bacterium SM1_46]|nr:MAG: hypothetical protein AMJ72_05425 [Acidithiobacillales bacterium SM1_46]